MALNLKTILFKKDSDAIPAISRLQAEIAAAESEIADSIPALNLAQAKVELEMEEGQEELAKIQSVIHAAEALRDSKKGALIAIQQHYKQALADAAEARLEANRKRGLELEPKINKLAGEVSREIKAACAKFKSMTKMVDELRTLNLPANCAFHDGPISEQALIGKYKLCMKQNGLDWATAWFGPGPIPNFEKSIAEGLEWALMESR